MVKFWQHFVKQKPNEDL